MYKNGAYPEIMKIERGCRYTRWNNERYDRSTRLYSIIHQTNENAHWKSKHDDCGELEHEMRNRYEMCIIRLRIWTMQILI